MNLARDLLVRPDWMDEAECAHHKDVDFFPCSGEPREPAKAVCRACPVQSQCRDYALRCLPEMYGGDSGGIWGGTSKSERHRLRSTAA